MTESVKKRVLTISQRTDTNLYVTVAFAVYVLIWFLHVGDRRDWLVAIRIELLWATALILLGVLYRPTGGYAIINNTLFKYVVLLFVVIAIQVPFSQDFDTSLRVFSDRFVKFTFMAWFICMFVRSPDQLRLFMAAFLFACFYELFDTFKGLLTGSMIWENQGVMRLHGMTSLTSHPNSLAGFALGSIPFAYYLLPAVQKKTAKVFLIALLLLAAICILYTGSRTGYIGFFFLLVTLILRSKNSKKVYLSLVLVGLFLVPIMPGQYVERFLTIFKGHEERGSSAEKRIEIIEDAICVVKSYPFGIGVSAFPAVRERLFGRVQDTHNLYLEVATNLGIQGLVVFAAFVWNILKSLASVARNLDDQLHKVNSFSNSLSYNYDSDDAASINRHQRDLQFMLGVCNAAIVYLITRLCLGLFGHDLYEIYWWFAIGIAISVTNMSLVAQKVSYDLSMRYGS